MPQPGEISQVSEETVRHVASLCRLELTDHQVRVEQDRLGEIIGYMDRLRSVGEHAPADVAQASREDLRRDNPGPTLSPGAVAELAPAVWNGYIRVPKVLGEGSSS